MKYYNNPDNNWFIPYRKGVKELWEFIDLVANEYGYCLFTRPESMCGCS